jgi:predicted phosphodiesterase
MSFKGEVISDIHINLASYTKEKISRLFPGGENLVLAGDIGDPDDLSLYTALDLARSKYKRVIYIPGNHEFYITEKGSKKTPASTIAWFKRLEDQWDTFKFFYRRTEVYDGVRIIGATGWSTSPRDTDWSKSISEEGRRDREFLQHTISLSKEPVLAITHYPPTPRILQENFRNKITEYDYAQNLEYMFRYPLHTWIFGHVHQAHDLKMPFSSSMLGAGNLRLLCAPYGYENEAKGVLKPKPFTVPSLLTLEESQYDTTFRML